MKKSKTAFSDVSDKEQVTEHIEKLDPAIKNMVQYLRSKTKFNL